jgi:hypothetical protein
MQNTPGPAASGKGPQEVGAMHLLTSLSASCLSSVIGIAQAAGLYLRPVCTNGLQEMASLGALLPTTSGSAVAAPAPVLPPPSQPKPIKQADKAEAGHVGLQRVPHPESVDSDLSNMSGTSGRQMHRLPCMYQPRGFWNLSCPAPAHALA